MPDFIWLLIKQCWLSIWNILIMIGSMNVYTCRSVSCYQFSLSKTFVLYTRSLTGVRIQIVCSNIKIIKHMLNFIRLTIWCGIIWSLSLDFGHSSWFCLQGLVLLWWCKSFYSPCESSFRKLVLSHLVTDLFLYFSSVSSKLTFYTIIYYFLLEMSLK